MLPDRLSLEYVDLPEASLLSDAIHTELSCTSRL